MTGGGFAEISFEVVERVAVLTARPPRNPHLISYEAMIGDIERACASMPTPAYPVS
jgi:hypothetical protein